MPSLKARLDVEFKTMDGLTLRGFLYPAAARGPAVVMSPGFNCVKEMLLPEVAENFQRGGVTALTYDPRSLGDSDGLPRNEIDPFKQVSDYSDAFDFLISQPMVDPAQTGFWGMSFSGSVAACSASLDKRARFLIMVCPMTVFYQERDMRKALAKTMRDRHAQLKGNAPFSLPPFTPSGDNIAGMASRGGQEAWEYLGHAKERAAPNYEHRTTLQTYYKVAMWQPQGLIKLLAPTPVMMLVPDRDVVALPAEQLAMFEEFEGPKRLHIGEGKGHFDILTGHDEVRLHGHQMDFVRDVIEGKL